jgi:phosphopantothenoylcysteine decarboxylase/phosphopantothenate--cysteine ligase
MPDIEAIAFEIKLLLNNSQSLAGKRVLVTTGGTIEKIDSVRTIANRSSGKMGIAIAEACYQAGATVTILRSVSSVRSRYGIQEIEFESAEDLDALLQTHVPNADIVFHVAAVSDFSIKNPIVGKHSSSDPLPLELEPKKKLLDTIKTLNPNVFLVAFKAEYGLSNDELATVASKRLSQSSSDLIIANDIGREGIGFQSDENEVMLIPKNGTPEVLPRLKTDTPRQIVI